VVKLLKVRQERVDRKGLSTRWFREKRGGHQEKKCAVFLWLKFSIP